jgi:hypothetical protein
MHAEHVNGTFTSEKYLSRNESRAAHAIVANVKPQVRGWIHAKPWQDREWFEQWCWREGRPGAANYKKELRFLLPTEMGRAARAAWDEIVAEVL